MSNVYLTYYPASQSRSRHGSDLRTREDSSSSYHATLSHESLPSACAKSVLKLPFTTRIVFPSPEQRSEELEESDKGSSGTSKPFQLGKTVTRHLLWPFSSHFLPSSDSWCMGTSFWTLFLKCLALDCWHYYSSYQKMGEITRIEARCTGSRCKKITEREKQETESVRALLPRERERPDFALLKKRRRKSLLTRKIECCVSVIRRISFSPF